MIQLEQFTDIGLLLLRFMVAAIFVYSGASDLKDPVSRSRSTGLSRGFTIFLGAAEVAGGLGLTAGILTQLAALGLILIMLGAIEKKIFAWHTGFWGEKNSGWHYDLMLIVMNLVILFTNGGRFVVERYLPFIRD